jgi:ribosome-associated heat shock protein Hsp15
MSRIDQYIWAVRLVKTRSLAANLCKANKVYLNGKGVKPAQNVNVGDEIFLKKNNAVFSYQVLNLLDRRVGAKLVDQYILDITPEEEIEKYKTYQEAQRQYRRSGLGKPSAKDRRAIKTFRKK